MFHVYSQIVVDMSEQVDKYDNVRGHTDFLVTFSTLFYAYWGRVAKALRNHVQPLSKEIDRYMD